jgi:hypothetical protein
MDKLNIVERPYNLVNSKLTDNSYPMLLVMIL